jgi:lysophospholipase L1-like esterase
MKPRLIPAVVFAATLVFGPSLTTVAHSQSQPEEIEWTWAVRPAHADARLPNVLLEGDSIARNYFPEVQKRLAGTANVYLMANSLCIGSPDLQEQIALFGKMEGVRFRVIHFNNGLHGGEYTEVQYGAGFPAYLASLRSIAPDATLIWTTTTPIKVTTEPGFTNARVDARNAIAATFAREMIIDDEHSLMEKHQDLYVDNVHFNSEGSNLMGDQVADTILRALNQPVPAK